MRESHVPALNWRYWTLISIASVLGANVGDCMSEVFDLGNVAGLPVLAAALAMVFIVERFERSVHDTYYWLSIIIVRTAATNIGDYAQQDLHLSKLATIGALAGGLIAVVLIGRSLAVSLGSYTRQADGDARPQADARYWIGMLFAGTLGTVIGDWASYGGYHIGNMWSSLILSAVLAVLLVTGRKGLLIAVPYYWLTVVAVRSAGTAVGDMFADERGIGVGLPIGTLVSAAVFIMVLAAWRNRSSDLVEAD